MTRKRLFTSESVTEGHPDKIADQISDAVLDEILNKDPKGKVACETLVTTGLILIAGEITTSAYVDIPTIARGVVKNIGYTDASYGFDYHTCSVLVSLDEQSPDIRMGVDRERLAHVRKNEPYMPYLRPDGKTQVTVEYAGGKPRRIDTIVVSTQHADEVDEEHVAADVREHIVAPVMDRFGFDPKGDFKLYVNPTGRFVEGGPKADCGLTGRKIIVDSYGGTGHHGGGAFSGKDPSKVDRSACYAARHIAKNVVAAGVADECEIQVAYAIGRKDPVSVTLDTFGTGKVEDEKLTKVVQDLFDLTPKGIIERLNLRRGIYRKTAAYGHFGREDSDFTWELTDYVEKLKSKLG
jgi:S-adenosylmethionine synthetase